MEPEELKSIFEAGGVILLLLSAFFAWGALHYSKIVNANQARELREFQERVITEQGNTARAQKEAAEAQLKLDQWLANKIVNRVADPEKFEPLKAVPKAHAEVFYKDGDGEAFFYARTIIQNLQGLGWAVPEMPTPTTKHPAKGNDGLPILGNYVIAKSIPHGAELFKEIANPQTKSVVFLLCRAVQGDPLENPQLKEHMFVIVVGEYTRRMTP